ncbi:hypothetical protein M2323_002605 [Rhodoblastus acidophilus]|uniref:hypothetical protein n=1 Tax=Rhodoblastus acidophilus TaxID=1074 RepID=UPI0022248922|nr:hypothetical protein [Rhodoblastus acidophilus]MCW2284718.1 hypothetical protein [Rhodoblastus acidophilus]MCW2333671.1 hypothetical protein [Rhodoblastus acidophilus]
MQSNKISTLAARLKASKEAYLETERSRGVDAGRAWAIEYADYEDLLGFHDCAFKAQTLGYSSQVLLDCFPQAGDIDYFFGDAADVSDEYVHGFVAGAIMACVEAQY